MTPGAGTAAVTTRATLRREASVIRPSFRRLPSSDGYFFRLAWWLGNARLRKYALAFGLDAKSGIDLPGENEGNWPTNAWELRAFGVPMEPSEACFLGIGQGAMQATPLQIVNVASAVINGGILYRPRVVREIRSPDGSTIARFPPTAIRSVPVT